MLLNGVIFVALLSALVACKSTESSLDAASSQSCADAGLLERVLGILQPTSVAPDRQVCLTQSFQAALDQQKSETKDKSSNDRLDVKEMNRSSSNLGDFSYTTNNRVDRKAYIRGPENFGAHRRLIARAQEEVLLQTYVWESVSSSAQEIMKGLQDLQKNRQQNCPACAPIVVRIVANYGPTALDALAAITNGERVVDYGADARVAIEALKLDPKILDVQVLTYTHKAFGTNHVKSLVVDGQIAMVTGANAQRFNDADVNWYDVGYMVAGDVAKGLRTDLINNLIRAGAGTEKDGNEELASGLGTVYFKKFSTVYPVLEVMADPFEDAAGIPMVITSRNGNGIPSQSNNNTQNRAFQAAFQGARKNIRIQTPNFNDDAAIRGLGAAVRRGVRVEMVQSKLFNCATENQVGQGGQNEKGIVRFIKEFGATAAQGPLHDIRWFTMIKDGKPIRVVDNTNGKKPEERPNNSHAKFMAVDDELVIVGSANMDTQSWNQSRELNVMVFHPEVTKAWQNQVFLSNFAIAQPVANDELVESKISCTMP